MRLYDRLITAFIGGVLTLTATGLLFAEEAKQENLLGTSDEVLARLGDVVLTQGEIDAAFNRIPAQHRLVFIRDGGRVDQLISRLMQSKALAHSARLAEFDREPLVAKRMDLAANEELVDAWLTEVVANAPKADYEVLAREYYTAHPEEFVAEATRDVSHILINSTDRSKEAALELAASLREQLVADPSRFGEFVAEYSDDPSKAGNEGRFAAVRKGQMVKEFEVAAFALNEPGELSTPVETAYGIHLIRLNSVSEPKTLEFERVKDKLMEKQRQEYLQNYRSRYIRQQTQGKIELPPEAIESLVRRYFGENFENAPELRGE